MVADNGLRERLQPQFGNLKVFLIVGQQRQTVVDRDGSNGGIGERKGLSMLAPLIPEGPGLFGDFFGHIVVKQPV